MVEKLLETAGSIFGSSGLGDAGAAISGAYGAPVTVGGLTVAPWAGPQGRNRAGGIDLSDPVTAVWVGAAVLIGGALVLRAVR